MSRSGTYPETGLAVSLLGGFRISAEGADVFLRGHKERAMFAFLALSRRRHSRTKLASVLWDSDGDTLHSLRQCLVNLRRDLGPLSKLLFVDRDGVELRPGKFHLDVAAFEALAGDRRDESLEQACRLYTGPLLDGIGGVASLFDDWLALEREGLSNLAMQAHRRLLDSYMSSNALDQAISLASRFVSLEPLQEEPRRTLMLLYAERGQTSAALRQYRALANILSRELGVEPDRETTEIFNLLRRGRVPGRKSRGPVLGAAEVEPPLEPPRYLAQAVPVLEQMPDCIMVTDIQGTIFGWNIWAHRVFGYAKKEVLGRKPAFLHDRSGSSLVPAELIAKALRYGRWSGVLPIIHKDGRSRLHKRTVLPLRDLDGRPVGVFGLSRPLTRLVPGMP